MPDAHTHTLFIVVDNTFRANHLGERSEPAPLADSSIVGFREPSRDDCDSPWEEGVQPVVVPELRKWLAARPNLRVRLACHLSSCFDSPEEKEKGMVQWKRMPDRRFPDEEGAIAKELKAELDLQVWGFRHDEDWSHVWRVLKTIEPQSFGEAAAEEDRRRLEDELWNAFGKAATTGRGPRHEHLAAIRHEILGLFVPLRLRLDTAASHEAAARAPDAGEKGAERAARAEKIRAEVSAAAEANGAKAEALMGEMAGLVIGRKKNELWMRASAMLKPDAAPAARGEEFRLWLDTLGDTLRELANTES